MYIVCQRLWYTEQKDWKLFCHYQLSCMVHILKMLKNREELSTTYKIADIKAIV